MKLLLHPNTVRRKPQSRDLTPYLLVLVFEEAGFPVLGFDLFIAFSPEREDPG